MTRWVVDSSMALAWGLPDEGSETADRFWSEVETGARLDVPALWWYEIANALVVARRRDRLDEGRARRLSRLIERLPVTTAAAPRGDDFGRLQAVAWKHGLSAYDAAYLELARILSAGLATLDERLAAAAGSEDLPVWG
jgi:predicted nucleic acid-binding protein